jgi:uncharacterized protein YndB with AHSA1/START domain
MANPLEKERPFVRGNLTRLRVLLGGSRGQAWRLIGTPKGLASWFPASVTGSIVPGRTVEFGWSNGSEKHRVLNVKRGESWQMDWWETGKVRYFVSGKDPTIFTLEARYPKKGKGKAWQQQEAVGWAFFLANLKSRSVKGPDLRSKNSKFSWQKGFID